MEALAARQDLVASAIGGDVTAFVLLLDPLWDPAHRLAFSMLRGEQSAEDAVQEAALKAWRNVRRLRPETQSLRPWFLTIVANQCRSMRRSPWWRVLPLSEFAERAAIDPEADQRIDLQRAMRALPYDQRLSLVLRYFLDLPMDEVAAVQRISVPAAKARVRRALGTPAVTDLIANCPDYGQDILVGDLTGGPPHALKPLFQLNCKPAGSIQPGARLSFEMRLGLPRGMVAGTYTLRFTLGYPWQQMTAVVGARVTIAP